MIAALLIVQLGVLAPAANARARKPKPVVVDAPEDVSASEHTRAGEAARERGDHSAAARSYETAYTAMPPVHRRSDAGAFVVSNAMRSYRDAFDANGSADELEASRALLSRFADERTSAGVTIPEFVAPERARIDRQLAAIAAASVQLEPVVQPSAPAQPVPSPVPIGPVVAPAPVIDRPPPVDEPALRLRRSGAAMIGLGGFAIAAGAVLLGVGATIGPSAARDRSDAREAPDYFAVTGERRSEYDASLDRYVDESRRVGRGFVIGGGSTMAAGAMGIVGGVIAIVRSRRALRGSRGAR